MHLVVAYAQTPGHFDSIISFYFKSIRINGYSKDEEGPKHGPSSV